LCWVYEPRTFILPCAKGTVAGAIVYKPDFYVPVPEVWLEVKPKAKPVIIEQVKSRRLSEATGQCVYSLYGAPGKFTAYQFQPGRGSNVPDRTMNPSEFFEVFVPASVDPLLILPATVKATYWKFNHE
jgi:hypothetical protein